MSLTAPTDVPTTHSPTDASSKPPRRLILCFDGTGNKFHGNSSDSNIVKLYKQFDHSAYGQKHYYQPGIGTYTADGSEMSTTPLKRLMSSVRETWDQGFATSFYSHVIAGYRFLMRYYEAGDRIYLFGFSRGAFTARYLARMVSRIGLLSKGNDELVPFAYKVYRDYELGTSQHSLGTFMKNFKTTFCRLDYPDEAAPDGMGGVKIYFLGLFDTVNSVGMFDIPFKPQVRVPEVHGTAQYIRHAVSIDERRVKFKAALLCQDIKAKDKKHIEDVKEVFFVGNHSDIGGGYIAVNKKDPFKSPEELEDTTKKGHTKPSETPNQDPMQLSDIPLKWMIDELEQLPDNIVWNKNKDDFFKNFKENVDEAMSSEVHDTLKFGSSDSKLPIPPWNILEYLPIAKRWEYRNGKWENVRLPLNAGGRRDIPPGAIFHSTVVARLRSDASYKPLNDVWCAGLKKPVALKNIQHEPAPDKAYFSMQDESTYEIQLGGQS